MKLRTTLLFAGLIPFVAGCSSLGLDSDPTYSDKNKEDMYKYGSLASEGGE